MPSTGKCFQILGLLSGASKEQIKQAHLDLVKVWHPDRFAHDPRLQAHAQEKLKEINEAYDVLTSPQVHAGPSAQSPHHQQPAKKIKTGPAPIVSLITLLIALAIVSLIFFIYGRPYESVHIQKSANELL